MTNSLNSARCMSCRWAKLLTLLVCIIAAWPAAASELALTYLGASSVALDNPHDLKLSPDGRHLYFIADVDGFSNIYRMELETGLLDRITNIATAVSGITWSAPAALASSNATLASATSCPTKARF